jgi:hypothetical protein
VSVLAMAPVLAGIAYDPNIRGVLVVLVSVVVLIGGPWLLLGTNMGSRLGFLVTATALFGWMAVMGAIWTAYGIGLVGELPSWTVTEVNVGDLEEAQLEEARGAPQGEDLPAVDELLEANPEVAEAFDEGVTVRLGDLVDADEDLVAEVNGWAVIGAAELGEPQTAAEEALTDGEAAQFESSAEYVVLRGFEQGGKPEREGDSVVDRVANKVTNTLQVTHPTHYAIVQVQASLPTEVPEGSAPLPPTPDPDAPVVSVIMVRNLGNLRLPTFILTVVFTGLFLFCAYLLHERDRAVMADRAAAGTA